MADAERSSAKEDEEPVRRSSALGGREEGEAAAASIVGRAYVRACHVQVKVQVIAGDLR